MGFELTSQDYVEYIRKAYEFIHAKGDYITALDSATGDGDHWINIDMGFAKVTEAAGRLETMSLSEEFKEIGRIMMSVVGGSSGVLYGSAYLAAAKVLKGKETIGSQELCDVLNAMLEAIISRGNAQRGFKTMIDCLAPAADCCLECIRLNTEEKAMIKMVKEAAFSGAESTKEMEAVRGRATYQANKGLGHLDPGAVTMSYQIGILMDCIEDKLKIGGKKMITNQASDRGQHIKDLRDGIEHRATWFYYLVKEAQKQGLGYEFAREAIKNCGRFHGDSKYTKTDDLEAFSKEFVSDNVRNIFEMDTDVTEEKFDITFHYCPLVAAWKKLTSDEEEIAMLCDIAMDGDRGIASTFPEFEFELGKTIAKGDPICQVTFKKNIKTNKH